MSFNQKIDEWIKEAEERLESALKPVSSASIYDNIPTPLGIYNSLPNNLCYNFCLAHY
jgi:hypothetical protein